jgi:hypothetical protein
MTALSIYQPFSEICERLLRVDSSHLDFQQDTTRTLYTVRRNPLFDRLAGLAVLDVLEVLGGAGNHFPARDFDLPHEFLYTAGTGQ